ncbi:MAG: YncE family protein [Bacteroidia bacterium]
MKHYFLILIVTASLYSCVKDKPNITKGSQVQLSTNKKVYIVNEGNFMAGNSSVSLYDPGSAQVIEKFYQDQNSASPLGDVAQSMLHFNSEFYIVVNNSSKIVVCDDQFKNKGIINGFTSPRYILPVSNSKAYVSDLYANKLFIVNLNTNAITSFIPCGGWTEKMVLSYSKAFVTNIKRNYVYVINTTNDTKTDSINIGPGAADIVVDKNDKIWVLSAGNQTASVVPTLKRINPLTNLVETTINFNLSDSPNNLCMNRTKDTLYFLNGGIFRIALSETSVPSSPLIPKGSHTYYGLGINPNDFTIYASDALDYIQRSNIYIFDAAGNEKSFFKAGINSNSFYFE